VTKGYFTVKEYGKVIKKVPIKHLKRVMVLSKGSSISTSAIYLCSKNGVDIDFIEKDEPYAMINYYKSIPYELHKKQLELMKSEKSLEIAREIVLTKAKNQQNLIKYYARYRKKSDFDEYEKLKKRIELIDTLYKRAKKADSVEKLMGYEGSISVSYWKAFGILIDDKNFKRVTQNASDAINQALNYGYAFIYNRVQSALLRAGLTLYYPFLHTQQKNKPALVFDMVEEFRQPIVDREIISILNKGGELNSSKGRLTADSVKLITQNIQERLATATKSRYGKQLLKNIIQEQSWQLSRVIDGKDDIFKGFVAKY
jgi:CRISPR-associated protein Cas1